MWNDPRVSGAGGRHRPLWDHRSVVRVSDAVVVVVGRPARFSCSTSRESLPLGAGTLATGWSGVTTSTGCWVRTDRSAPVRAGVWVTADTVIERGSLIADDGLANLTASVAATAAIASTKTTHAARMHPFFSHMEARHARHRLAARGAGSAAPRGVAAVSCRAARSSTRSAPPLDHARVLSSAMPRSSSPRRFHQPHGRGALGHEPRDALGAVRRQGRPLEGVLEAQRSDLPQPLLQRTSTQPSSGALDAASSIGNQPTQIGEDHAHWSFTWRTRTEYQSGPSPSSVRSRARSHASSSFGTARPTTTAGESVNRGHITRAGNVHVRTQLVASARAYQHAASRGVVRALAPASRARRRAGRHRGDTLPRSSSRPRPRFRRSRSSLNRSRTASDARRGDEAHAASGSSASGDGGAPGSDPPPS